ncbi:MAG: hypothetical protein MZV65_25735 [Chromatiales bacterium]|nr:hypothetical protein [Chromatiales bacterium]
MAVGPISAAIRRKRAALKRDSPEAYIAVWPRMVAQYKAEWPILEHPGIRRGAARADDLRHGDADACYHLHGCDPVHRCRA